MNKFSYENYSLIFVTEKALKNELKVQAKNILISVFIAKIDMFCGVGKRNLQRIMIIMRDLNFGIFTQVMETTLYIHIHTLPLQVMR